MATSSVAMIGPEACGSGASPDVRPGARATRVPATPLDFQILLLALLGPGLADAVVQEQDRTAGIPCSGATAPASSSVDKPGDPVSPQELVALGPADNGRERAAETKGQEMLPSDQDFPLLGSQESSPFRVPPRDGVSMDREDRSLPTAGVFPDRTSGPPAERRAAGPGSPGGETSDVIRAREALGGGERTPAEDRLGGKDAAGVVRVRILRSGATGIETPSDVSQLNSADSSGTRASGGSGKSSGEDDVHLPGGASDTARVRFQAATRSSADEEGIESGEVRDPADDVERSGARRQKTASHEMLRVVEDSVARMPHEAPGNDLTRAAGSEGTKGMPAARAHAPERTETRAVEMEIAQPELGKVTVLLTTRGGEVHVRFVSPDGGLREALWEGRQELFHAMSGRGLNLAGFLVDSGWNPPGENGSPGEKTRRLVLGRRSEMAKVTVTRPAGMGEKQGLVDYVV